MGRDDAGRRIFGHSLNKGIGWGLTRETESSASLPVPGIEKKGYGDQGPSKDYEEYAENFAPGEKEDPEGAHG